MFFFFFSSRRRHTRLQGDWSSDVCSSDLGPTTRQRPKRTTPLSSVPRARTNGLASRSREVPPSPGERDVGGGTPRDRIQRGEGSVTEDARPMADRRIPCPVLIGRETEIGRLAALLRECLGGRGRTALVSGEAGVGKTAVLRQFAQQGRAKGARVFL